MIPGNVDPRRPDKVQRYKPNVANGNGQAEEIGPDYMNILGQQRATTANADELSQVDQQQQAPPQQPSSSTTEEVLTDVEAPNVIPTSPQYGVAIIGDCDTMQSVDTSGGIEIPKNDDPTALSKDPLHSTPSRNDRFKVVKIASLEPFKRGRWKCMDYMDEAPPPPVKSAQQAPPTASSATSAAPATVYLQTQSLPQQQIQQMLLQSAGQYYQPVVPAQTQYFYGTAPPPPGQYATPTYFAAAPVPANAAYTLPANFQNVQYVPANLIQTNQGGSAFVSTSFQQGQTYAGPPPVSQPMVNGHAYPPPTVTNANEQQQQQITSSTTTIPTQSVKSVILNQQQQQQQQQQQHTNQQSVAQQPVQSYQQQQQPQLQNANQPGDNSGGDKNPTSSVYTNPQFAAMNVNSLTVLDGETGQTVVVNSGGGEPNNDAGASVTATNAEAPSENADEPKTNPVNAIDNKIELAMDLVKSHLMYTVREEVEVLKEKIAELMEKIQQLESENNYLRSQIPKNGSTTAPPPASNLNQPSQSSVSTPNTVTSSTSSGSSNTSTSTTQSVAPSGDV